MAGPDKAEILKALSKVVDSGKGEDIVTAGMVAGLAVEEGRVRFALEVDPARGPALEPLRQAAEAAAKSVPGVTSVMAALTAHSDTPSAPKAAPKAPPPDLGTRAKPGDKPLRAPAPPPNDGRIEGVQHVIAVGSGKGGVGKSTVSANLAVALAMEGYRVGLLDADVYGPSQPRMLGISGRPASPDGKTIHPLEGFGVKCMSMGFLTAEGESVIWRGPMLMSAVTQMLFQVKWAPLDFLIIDLPRHRRCAIDAEPENRAFRRGNRLHPAGCGAAGCAQGHRHVQKNQDAAARCDREYGDFLLPELWS